MHTDTLLGPTYYEIVYYEHPAFRCFLLLVKNIFVQCLKLSVSMSTTYNEQISFSVQLLVVSGTKYTGYFMKKPRKEIR